MRQTELDRQLKGKKARAGGRQKLVKSHPQRVVKPPEIPQASAADIARATSSLSGVIGRLLSGALLLFACLLICFYLIRAIWLGEFGNVVILVVLFLVIPLYGAVRGAVRSFAAARELPASRHLSARGQDVDGSVQKLMEFRQRVQWSSSPGWLTLDILAYFERIIGSQETQGRVDHYYYVIVDYVVLGQKYAVQQEITHEESLDLEQGSKVKVRYLPDLPLVARLPDY